MSPKPDEDATKCTNQVWGARDLNGERELESDGYFFLTKNYKDYYSNQIEPIHLDVFGYCASYSFTASERKQSPQRPFYIPI